MKIPNRKTEYSILSNLEKIKKSEFDESTIKELFWDTREFFKEYTFLKEVADFLAHQNDKSQGISYLNVDLTYCKLKYHFIEQTKKNIDINIVPRKLFDILFKESIKQFDENILKEKNGITRKELQKLITSNYPNSNNRSRVKLERRNNIDIMVQGLNTIISTLTLQPIFGQEQIITQLRNGINRLLMAMNINIDYSNSIKINSTDIMVCIIALLHDVKFPLHDDSSAYSFLQSNVIESNELELGIFDNAVLSLDLKYTFVWDGGKSDMSYQLISTKAKTLNYIDDYKFNFQNSIKEIHTIREKGKLKLISK